MRNWWTPETNAQFVEATKKLGAQYATHCPLEGACVNGELTMGENIGDLGGLEMAYTAYKLSLNGQEAPVLDGFTGDQRFFLSFAQAWRGKMRDDALRAQMLTDPHSPREARGTFPERNMDAWYAAFDVQAGRQAVSRAQGSSEDLVKRDCYDSSPRTPAGPCSAARCA